MHKLPTFGTGKDWYGDTWSLTESSLAEAHAAWLTLNTGSTLITKKQAKKLRKALKCFIEAP